MKIDFATRAVSMTPTPVNRQFSIAMNSKMFEVLYSSLYKRPKDAIIREITSNIFDAHLLNGHVGPGRITLPSPLEPTLIFRDYGPGLNAEAMENLYTTLGASTKEDDEDAIGNYGLGSKTPMAYTDAFTAVSRHLGKMRVYTIVKGADLIPRLMSDDVEYESDEPDGLEIKIPCKPGDEEAWTVVAKRVLQWFPRDLVEVVGTEIPEPSFVYETEKWALRAYTDAPSCVLMGPVTYELDWTILESGPQKRVVFKMPMGAVQPQPSREGLTYDPRTLRVMNEAIAEFNVEFARWIEDQLDGLSLYDATIKFRKLKAAWPGMPMPIGRSTEIVTESSVGYINIRSAKRANKYGDRKKKFTPEIQPPGFCFKPSDQTLVILNDIEDPRDVRLKKRLAANEYRFYDDAAAVLVNDLAHIGNPSRYVRLSDFHLPARTGRPLKGKTTRVKPMIYTVDPHAGDYGKPLEETLWDEPGFGTLWTPVNIKTLTHPDWELHSKFASQANRAVFGLTKRAQHYYREVEMEPLDKFVARRCREMSRDKDLLEAYARRVASPEYPFIGFLRGVDDLPTDLRRFMTEFGRPRDHPDMDLLHFAINNGIMSVPKLPKVFDFRGAEAKLRAKYALFFYIVDGRSCPPTDKDKLATVLSALKVRQ